MKEKLFLENLKYTQSNSTYSPHLMKLETFMLNNPTLRTIPFNTKIEPLTIKKQDITNSRDNPGVLLKSINYLLTDERYVKLRNTILDFKNVGGDLLNFIDEKPNDTSVKIALTVLKNFFEEKIYNPKISLSPDGGVIFEILNFDNYYLLEIFNDGDIVFLIRNNATEKRKVFDITGAEIENTIKLIVNG